MYVLLQATSPLVTFSLFSEGLFPALPHHLVRLANSYPSFSRVWFAHPESVLKPLPAPFAALWASPLPLHFQHAPLLIASQAELPGVSGYPS